jgi:hypothetical protein
MASRTQSEPSHECERGSGTELWLLRVGSDAELAARTRVFDAAPIALVLCPPSGAEERWARAFSARHGERLECRTELRSPDPGEESAQAGERAWLALETVCARAFPRLLAVLPHDVLGATAARALGLGLPGAAALRVDPGRAVCLRDDPIGIVLRRSNVLAPETSSGTALPGGFAGSPR